VSAADPEIRAMLVERGVSDDVLADFDRLAAQTPEEPRTPLRAVRLHQLGVLDGYQVTVANQADVMEATGGQPFSPGRNSGPAECFYISTPQGNSEINIGDVLVRINGNGAWWQILEEDIGVLWMLEVMPTEGPSS
jgi:hypothetical protein